MIGQVFMAIGIIFLLLTSLAITILVIGTSKWSDEDEDATDWKEEGDSYDE